MFGGDEVGALVLDLGSHFSKAGYAGEDTPKAVFHTAVGSVWSEDVSMDVDSTEHASGVTSTAVGSSSSASASSSIPASSSGMVSSVAATCSSGKQYLVGRSQFYRRDHMRISHPVRNGLVEDWDAVEAVWSYALGSHLRVDPKDHPLMVSEPTFQPAGDREKMLQLMFERFAAPATFLCKSSVLTAFSAGRATACVVESGAGHTTVAPVHDGYVVNRGVRRSQFGGDKLDVLLEKTLQQGSLGHKTLTPAYQVEKKYDSDGHLVVSTHTYPQTHPSFHRFQQLELLRDIKESLCRLSESAFDSNQKFPNVTYELPDGQSLDVGNERFIVPEHIFNPKFTPLLDLKHDFDGVTYRGLQHQVLDSVESVDVDLRKDLYSSIVLSGGNTLFPGIPNRLTKEVGGVLSAAHKVKVVGGSSLNDRRFAVWIGGSILASLGTFHQMWISKAEYEEQGAAMLAAKCP